MQLSASRGKGSGETHERSNILATLTLALVPLLLLGGVLVLIATVGLPGGAALPVERLVVERVVIEPGLVEVRVRNVGPEPVTVTTVTVDDVLTDWTASPDATIPRLRAASFTMPHGWVEGEPVEVKLITSKGFAFTGGVEAAVATPRADMGTLGTLALLGLYVGAIPVLIGLLWRPLLSRLAPGTLALFLGVTVGLLLFLAFDSFHEGLESSEALPGPLGGPFILVAGAIGAFAVLELVGRRSPGAGARAPLALATLVALGVGLHNLAEGLAVGGAFALGEVALGAFLVVGFALHNTTEGLAIVAPLSRERVSIAALVGLGLLAGLPTVVGAWVGGLAPSPFLAVAFLGVGTGAILQVARQIDGATEGDLRRGLGLAGVAIGVLVMFATSLIIPI